MPNITCPFYNQTCILKEQANLPDFKNNHDCGSKIDHCSFFIRERVKQKKSQSDKIKIIIKQVSNPYLVQADGLIYPTNNLLFIDDKVLHSMTRGEAQNECKKQLIKGVKMGYCYPLTVADNWKIKQKVIINAVVAGESRLVNEADVISCMKKAVIMSDQMGLESIVILPCDNGTYDISLVSMAQLSSILVLTKSHEFANLKSIYICMSDEESEQSFIEYYNRIFGEKNEQ